MVQGVSTGVVETDFDDMQAFNIGYAVPEQIDETSSMRKSTAGAALKPQLQPNEENKGWKQARRPEAEDLTIQQDAN